MTEDLFCFNSFYGSKMQKENVKREKKNSLETAFYCLQFMILKILMQFCVFVCLFIHILRCWQTIFFLLIGEPVVNEKTLMSYSPYGVSVSSLLWLITLSSTPKTYWFKLIHKYLRIWIKRFSCRRLEANIKCPEE